MIACTAAGVEVKVKAYRTKEQLLTDLKQMTPEGKRYLWDIKDDNFQEALVLGREVKQHLKATT